MLIKSSDEGASGRDEILLHIGSHSVAVGIAEIVEQCLPGTGLIPMAVLLNICCEALKDRLIRLDRSPVLSAVGSDGSPELFLDDDLAVTTLMGDDPKT